MVKLTAHVTVSEIVRLLSDSNPWLVADLVNEPAHTVTLVLSADSPDKAADFASPFLMGWLTDDQGRFNLRVGGAGVTEEVACRRFLAV